VTSTLSRLRVPLPVELGPLSAASRNAKLVRDRSLLHLLPRNKRASRHHNTVGSCSFLHGKGVQLISVTGACPLPWILIWK